MRRWLRRRRTARVSSAFVSCCRTRLTRPVIGRSWARLPGSSGRRTWTGPSRRPSRSGRSERRGYGKSRRPLASGGKRGIRWSATRPAAMSVCAPPDGKRRVPTAGRSGCSPPSSETSPLTSIVARKRFVRTTRAMSSCAGPVSRSSWRTGKRQPWLSAAASSSGPRWTGKRRVAKRLVSRKRMRPAVGKRKRLVSRKRRRPAAGGKRKQPAVGKRRRLVSRRRNGSGGSWPAARPRSARRRAGRGVWTANGARGSGWRSVHCRSVRSC